MRRLLYIFSFLVFISCQKESGNPASTVQLNVTPSVLSQQTKALVTDIKSQTIGVQVTNAAGTALYQTGTDNVALTNTSSVWGLASPVYLSSSAAKLYAYAPYSAVAGDFTGIGTAATRLLNIPASQTMSNQTDYLWAAQDKTTSGGSTNITNSNASVTLTMNHALAQVAFVIYKDCYSGTGNLTQISIVDKLSSSFKINKSGTNDLKMSIADGTITGGQASSSLTVAGISNTISLTSDPGTTPATLDGQKNAYLLLAPVTIADQSSLRLQFTIDGSTYSVPTGTGSLSWLKGNQYIYTLKLTGSKALIVQSVTVTPWGTNSISETNIDESGLFSTKSPANCHILASGGSIEIPVGVKGNGDAASAALGNISKTHTAYSVGKVWESTAGLVNILNFNASSQTAVIKASMSEGNAVIAAYDSDGTTILWSWHIWVTDTPAEETVNGYTWMDRNLGATDVANGTSTTFATCGGLFYQWGRKDPFPGSNGSTINNATTQTIYNFSMPAYTGLTISYIDGNIKSTDASASPISYTAQLAYSIKYPLLFLINWSGSTGTATAAYTAVGGKDSWGGEYGQVKSIFDPCPVGWRVPSGRKSSSTWTSPWSTWTTTQSSSVSTYNARRWYNGSSYLGVYYYPVAGVRMNTNGLQYVGQMGYSWSATTSGTTAYTTVFGEAGMNSTYNFQPMYAVTLRCVRE